MAVNPADVCLLLLSIVNKDLLFLIIESYDCNLMIRSYTQLSHIFFFFFLFWRSSLLSASITSFLSFHTVICWPLVIRKQTGGLVWLPTASLQTWLCVCAWDIRSQTGLCFQGWCFSLCGIWAANVSVCASTMVFLLGCLRKSLVIYNEIRPISVFIHFDQTAMRQNSVIHCEFRLHMAPQLSPFTMSFANLCVSPWWACSDDSSRSGEQPLLP